MESKKIMCDILVYEDLSDNVHLIDSYLAPLPFIPPASISIPVPGKPPVKVTWKRTIKEGDRWTIIYEAPLNLELRFAIAGAEGFWNNKEDYPGFRLEIYKGGRMFLLEDGSGIDGWFFRWDDEGNLMCPRKVTEDELLFIESLKAENKKY